MAKLLMATTRERSMNSTSRVIVKPIKHVARAGVFVFGSSFASVCGRSFLFAIAYAMRDTPRIEVSRTLAVARIPPMAMRVEADGFPVAFMACSSGEFEFASVFAPTSPTATIPTRT